MLFAACALLAFATPLFSSPLLGSRITPLSRQAIADATALVQFTRTGYCNSTVINSWTCGAACDAVAPVTTVALGGDGKSAPNWHVLYWHAKRAIVIVHEGTSMDSLHSIAVDLRLNQIPLNPILYPGSTPSIKVHRGFLAAQSHSAEAILVTVRDILRNKIPALGIADPAQGAQQIFVTGYSLGAAVAVLDAIYLQLNLKTPIPVSAFSVGTPMIGNPEFAAWADQVLKSNTRVVNDRDIIPRLPDLTGADWEQCGVEYHVSEGGTDWYNCGTSANYGDDPRCSRGFSPLKAQVTDHWMNDKGKVAPTVAALNQPMYERDLQDLIRGLRSDAAKKNEPRFIAEVVDEIRKEISGKDMDVKGGAICKLTYLDMLGYDMSWASFHVVEVMSSPHFHVKSGGYLAAAQSFDQSTDVLMLTTNLLKKDMASAAPPDISASLNCLAQIMTPSLAQDLSTDLIPMLHHSRPLIRKRAVLVLYKMILHDPEVFDRAIGKLREKLEDPEIGVVSATVNVLCELARLHPQRCLPLAPHLFNLLTSSSNNWTLIKVVKLFGSLTPYEPRLVRKLQPPLTDLISTTPAISLLYECVRTCIIGEMFHGAAGSSLARTCVQKLAAFLDDTDQNLKYIALLALVKIVPSHPHLVAEHQRLILASVNDSDISIRIRALDLVSAMVTRDTLQHVVQHLLSHLTGSSTSLSFSSASHALSQAAGGGTANLAAPTMSPAYRLDVSRRIIHMCSRDLYDNVDDFEWYLSVLVDLSYVAGVDIGSEVKEQLLDVAVRVRSVREFAVRLMVKLLSDDSLIVGETSGSSSDVLWAASWICGEFCQELERPNEMVHLLLRPKVEELPASVLSMYIMAATKVFGYWSSELASTWDEAHDIEGLQSSVDRVILSISNLVDHSDIEVQERASNFYQLLQFVRADVSSTTRSHEPPIIDTTVDPSFPKSLRLVHPLSSTLQMNAVAPEAQMNVRAPDGLDLDHNLVPEALYGAPMKQEQKKRRKRKDLSKSEAIQEQYDQGNDPASMVAQKWVPQDDVEAIPIINLDHLVLEGRASAPPEPVPKRMVRRPAVDTGGEMPESVQAVLEAVSTPNAAEIAPIASPQAIRVVRNKKSSKPKRTAVLS